MAAGVLFKQVPHSGKVTNVPYYFADDLQMGDPMFYFDQLPVRFHAWSQTIKLNDSFTCKTPQLLRVSEKNVKYISRNPNCKHIDEFFCTWDEENSKLTMDKHLVKYLTGKAVGNLPPWIRDIAFINPDYGTMYHTLYDYQESYRHYESTHEEVKGILDTIERIKDFQTYAESVDDPVLIAQKSKELFILEDIKAAQALDSEILRLIAMKDELMDGVHPLMKHLAFTNCNEFEKEVTYYLKSRGKLDIDIPLPQTS